MKVLLKKHWRPGTFQVAVAMRTGMGEVLEAEHVKMGVTRQVLAELLINVDEEDFSPIFREQVLEESKRRSRSAYGKGRS